MRSLSVGASSLEVARGIYGALADFHPEILDSDDGGFQIRVSLLDGDAQIIAILNAIEHHVMDQQRPARVEVDGRSYTVNP